MKVGHLRKLLASYSDDCELLVEMVLPGEPAKTSDDQLAAVSLAPASSEERSSRTDTRTAAAAKAL